VKIGHKLQFLGKISNISAVELPPVLLGQFQHCWRSGLSISMSGCQKLQMTAWPGLAHRMLYSCTHMATVGIKGLVLLPSHFNSHSLVHWKKETGRGELCT